MPDVAVRLLDPEDPRLCDQLTVKQIDAYLEWHREFYDTGSKAEKCIPMKSALKLKDEKLEALARAGLRYRAKPLAKLPRLPEETGEETTEEPAGTSATGNQLQRTVQSDARETDLGPAYAVEDQPVTRRSTSSSGDSEEGELPPQQPAEDNDNSSDRDSDGLLLRMPESISPPSMRSLSSDDDGY